MTASDFNFFLVKKKIYSITQRLKIQRKHCVIVMQNTRFSVLTGCNVSEEEHIVKAEQIKDVIMK